MLLDVRNRSTSETSIRGEIPAAFPFPRIRPGQDAFLTDAIRAMLEGRHLLAHAPTGIGKTAVALTAALADARRMGHLVFFLTSKQSQHWMAVETLRRIAARGHRVVGIDVIAKRGMCLQERAPAAETGFQEFCDHLVRSRRCGWFARSAEPAVKIAMQKVLHVRELIETAQACGTCPHKAAIEAARQADVVVCDYNYVFSDIRDRILPRIERTLDEIVLIVDEAHNLPDRIRAHLTGDLDVPTLVRAAKEARIVDSEAGAHLQGIARSVRATLLAENGERTVGKGILVEAVERGLRGIDYRDLIRFARAAGEALAERGLPSVLPQVTTFLGRWWDHDEGILRLIVGGELGRFSIRLLDPAILSGPVFHEVHASILMSGTLHPPEMYANLLGIPPERRILGVYRSPFPPENRPVLVSPRVTTSYGRRSATMYASIAREAAAAAHAVPGNVAAFFPSYELLENVVAKLRPLVADRTLHVERAEWGAADRARALEAMRSPPDRRHALLLGVLGGSLSEGVDYPGNLLSAVIVVGLPLSPPNLEVEALKAYYATRFGVAKGYDYAYVYPAVSRVLQAAGRCIRSEEDRAAVVVLESRVLDARYSRCFPPDFPLRAVPDVEGSLRRFLNGAPLPQAHAPQAGRGSRDPEGHVDGPPGGREVPPAEAVPPPRAG
ncbi:MAG TPA: ATP-dependent DNA helicase [Thermoplasmata archaeon]|nr:ATP-dependent DNA helicase [Thermoplasmata archaeon]